MKKILTIAGSDCSGGAGIQADLKTFSAHGLFGMSVIISVVAENTSRVISFQDINIDIIKQQIDAIFEDIEVDAVKIGMLSNSEIMLAVAEKIKEYNPPNIVIDPVMYAKNGDPLMDPNAIDTLISEIIPLAHILTPNLPEAEKIAKQSVTNIKEIQEGAKKILAMGCESVLIKGGHFVESSQSVDTFYDGNKYTDFIATRINTKNTHGTGCTFSSAIASNLALGMSKIDAIEEAKKYITTSIEHALPIGKGHGPTNHFYELYKYGLNKGGKI